VGILLGPKLAILSALKTAILTMPKHKLTQGDISLIIANLIPVYGVWFLGWNAVEVFTVYAMETLIVGGLTLLKMLVVTLTKHRHTWYSQGGRTQVSGLFFMVFFTLHYGLFAAVQTTIFSQTADITPPGSGALHFFFHWWEYINKDTGLMLAGFVAGYLAKSFAPFIVSGEYKTTSLMRLMFQPYGRIFIQQFTVIIGAMFLSLGLGKGFVLIFALVKILFEVYVNFNGIIGKTMDDLEKESS
jgi:hypothetical protein